MADETTVQQTAEQAAAAMDNLIKSMNSKISSSFDLLKKIVGDKGSGAAEEFIKQFARFVEDQKENFFPENIDLASMFTINGGVLQSKIESTLLNVGSKIKSSGLTDLAIEFGVKVDNAAIDGALGTIGKTILNTQTVAEVGIYKMMEGFGKAIGGALKPLTDLEDRAMSISKAAVNLFGSRMDTSNTLEATASFDKLNAVYREQLQNVVKLGINLNDASSGMANLAKSSTISLDQIALLGTASVGTSEALSGLAGFQRVVAATGVDAGKASDLLRLQMRSLGVEAQDSLTVFGMLSNIQRGTRISTNEIVEVVTKGAAQFELYGNNIEGVGTIYKQLLDGLGTGKEKLAADIFQKVATGISGMSLEMKAFIGMTSQLGGGGGALESALRIEEAIASGEGLTEVYESIYEKIEKISGAPILDRAEALATGQFQKYVTQRQVGTQMLGVNELEYEQMAQSRKNGQPLTMDQIRPTGGDVRSLEGRSDANLGRTIGASNRFVNQMQGAADLQGSAELSKSLASISEGFVPVGKNLVDVMEKLSVGIREAAGKSPETLINRIKVFSESRSAKDQVPEDLRATGGAPLGKDIGDAAQFAGAVQMRGAGLKSAEELANPVGVEGASGIKGMEQFAGVLERSTLASIESIAQYTTINELQKNAIQLLDELMGNAAKVAATLSLDKQREIRGAASPTAMPGPSELANTIPTPPNVEIATQKAKAREDAESATKGTSTNSSPMKFPIILIPTFDKNSNTVTFELSNSSVSIPINDKAPGIRQE